MLEPIIREMEPAEAEALLQRQHVGRIAFVRDDRVDMEPIHYIADDGWIFGRTSPGTKLDAVAHRPWVAFEVDEVRGPEDWESVVVHGTLYVLTGEGTAVERREYTRAINLLRRHAPDTFTRHDLHPWRTVLFGIHADAIAGRAASPVSVPAR